MISCGHPLWQHITDIGLKQEQLASSIDQILFPHAPELHAICNHTHTANVLHKLQPTSILTSIF